MNVKMKMCTCQIKLSLLVQIGRGMYTVFIRISAQPQISAHLE